MRLGAALLAVLLVLAGCAGPASTDWFGTDATTPGTATPSTDRTATPTTEGTATHRVDGIEEPVTARTGTATAARARAAGDDASSTPTATSRPPSPTPRTAGRVAVSGLPLDVDEERVYRAVVEMHGREYESAPAVDLRVKERPAPSRTDQVWEPTAFMELWGFDPSAMNETSIAGLAVGTRVFLYTEPVPTSEGRRSVLAHEFTHVLQHDAGAFERTMAGIRQGDGNARRVYTAVVEGTATYAQERYVAEKLNGTAERPTWAEATENRSRFGVYAIAPYVFGPRYVRERVDSLENLDAVYDRPPRTTEQVIHGYGPGEEPARPLSVRVDEGAGTEWYQRDERVRGELFVRLVLEGQLDRERAADAAAGWGADRVVTFGEAGAGTRAHAWVLRWDDASEADAFAAAVRDYLDGRADRAAGRWVDGDETFDLRRVGDETVVVLAGPDRFVDAASVDGTSANVTVGVGE